MSRQVIHTENALLRSALIRKQSSSAIHFTFPGQIGLDPTVWSWLKALKHKFVVCLII